MTKKLTSTRTNYKKSKEQVEYIKSLFQQSGVKINEQSFLFKILQDVEVNFSETDNLPEVIFNALRVDRIAHAIKCLENKELKNKQKYLKDLLNGSLDFLEHKASHAKSILWELEVLTSVNGIFPKTFLDEPDVVIPFEDGDIGISCKKVTSEKSVSKVLSKAVQQIENNSFDFGIVAINIDDLFPEQAILNKDTHEEAADILFKRNIKFISDHERHFIKYLKDSRIIAVLVSSTVPVDIKNGSPRFNNLTEKTFWTISDLKESHKAKLETLKKLAH